MTRCFLCVELTDKVLNELARIQSEIKYKGKILFPKKENLHLTLKFLGDISDETVENIKKRLKNIKCPPIKTSLSSLGTFPDLNYVRVILIGLTPDKEIKELYNKIENELSGLDFKKDSHPFSSHITIGRVKFLKSKEALTKSINDIKVDPIEFEMKEFSLKASALTPAGSEYKTLSSFLLNY